MSFLSVDEETKRNFYREYFRRERAAGRMPRSFRRWLDQIEAGEYMIKNGLAIKDRDELTWEGK